MTDYREYNCNLGAPYIRAKKALKSTSLQTGAIDASSIDVSGAITANQLELADGLKIYSGTSSLNTTHTLTIPALAKRLCRGEITLYLDNEPYVNLSMMVVVKIGGIMQTPTLYQRVGNYTSVSAVASGDNIIVTTSPASNLTWSFRGI